MGSSFANRSARAPGLFSAGTALAQAWRRPATSGGQLQIEFTCPSKHTPIARILSAGEAMAADDQTGDLAEELRRKADRIASLIVASDYPDVDIEIEIRVLRRWCAEHLPDRLDLFEMVYASRFRRLREQFRTKDEPGPGRQ
jgi:hypothetical protein